MYAPGYRPPLFGVACREGPPGGACSVPPVAPLWPDRSPLAPADRLLRNRSACNPMHAANTTTAATARTVTLRMRRRGAGGDTSAGDGSTAGDAGADTGADLPADGGSGTDAGGETGASAGHGPAAGEIGTAPGGVGPAA